MIGTADMTIAHTPPPEIAQFVEALSPEKFIKANAGFPEESVEAWRSIADRLGMAERAEEIDSDFMRSLFVALLALPEGELHKLSKRFPMEIAACAATAWSIISEQDPRQSNDRSPEKARRKAQTG